MTSVQVMTIDQIKHIGIKDERWSTQDKLQMYKGVVKLYNQEQKNQIKDINALRKKNSRKIAKLQQEVRDMQKKYSQSILGDKQQIRAAMSNHQQLKLTYENSDPDKTIENIKHKNFRRRKQLEELRYKKMRDEKKLLEMKVSLGDLQDEISAPDFGRMDLQQQTMSNQIQNYMVKFCAAQNIKNVYQRMLVLLRKDQGKYSAILSTLMSDAVVQHKCLIRATEMGQLATEEICNLRQEYARMEKRVRKNMRERQECMLEVRDKLQRMQSESQELCRMQSKLDLKMALKEEPKVTVNKNNHDEVSATEDLVNTMKTMMVVPTNDDILPRMLETMSQNRRLLEELECNSNACDDLLERRHHAELLLSNLRYSGNSAAKRFKAERNSLKAQISQVEELKEKIVRTQDTVSHRSVMIRQALNRLCQILEEIQLPPEYHDITVPSWPLRSNDDDVDHKAPISEESQRLLHLLESKLNYVKSKLKEGRDPEERQRAFVAHFHHFNKMNSVSTEDVQMAATDLITEVLVEDAHVPGRAEIKERSKQLCEEATRNLYEEPERKKSWATRKRR